MNAVLRSAIARALSFLPTAVATLLTSRLIIQHYGILTFDAFALVLTLISLIPLNNLGVGAAVTTTYAAEGPESEHSRRVTLTAARTLAVSSVGTAAVVVGLTAIHAWPSLLGVASGPNKYTGLAALVFALSFLPGLGQSMLLGVHRNHVVVISQTFFTPLILLGTVGVIGFGVTGDAVMLGPPISLVIINILTCALATRSTGISWRWLLRALPWRRRYPGASIRGMSGPVLLITLATPIALQSDRLVLSHVSTTQAVADYSVVMQIFAPAIALIAASAQPLWPIYAAARAEGRSGPSLPKMLLLFGGAGALCGALLALVANPVASLIGGDQIHLGWLLPLAGALAVVTAALSYPVAMSLMDPSGVRLIATLTLVALPLNIGLSIIFARHWGAAGPLFASVLVGILVQTLPGVFFGPNGRSGGRHRA
ncbi:MAG: polysaccharide biosynthesis protein [Marmoricola sp.]|nr:polysaccharide biosynthesis protein [Marmoricola sp.]